MKRNIITLLTAGITSLAALGGAAWADNRDNEDIALFQKASQNVAAAIRAAETATGGKAVAAGFEEANHAGVWDVDTVAGTKRAEVRIDAMTGQVVSNRDKGDLGSKHGAATPDMLGGTLTALAAKAEAAGGGKVMSIDADRQGGQFRGMEVKILKTDGSVQGFILAPVDGKLTPVGNGHGNDHDDY